jgi:hypothetical protein
MMICSLSRQLVDQKKQDVEGRENFLDLFQTPLGMVMDSLKANEHAPSQLRHRPVPAPAPCISICTLRLGHSN